VHAADDIRHASAVSAVVKARGYDVAPVQPKLLIVIASTRPGRVGLPVANWFIERATAHGGFELELADLHELDLPFLDEPKHPRLREYSKQHTRVWSAIVDAADSIVFVTSEYNYGYPAALKNALDYLHHEWVDKPVGFVSYGGVAAGTRSVQQLRQVVGALRMVSVNAAVHIPFIAQFLDEDRVIQANDVMIDAAATMLDELVRLEAALRPLRAGE
jgi:NAD(P)H-dependent FMN reductase